MELRGGDGPQVTFVPASRDQALTVADQQVDVLFDEGWDAGDIALITLGQRHPVQAERQASRGQQRYWERFWDTDDIFYGHVLGFKGMERRAVVLCVNEHGNGSTSACPAHRLPCRGEYVGNRTGPKTARISRPWPPSA